jgi:hypothetical protein
VLSLHPERHSGWLVESDFSLAAAVSYSVPLGMAEKNVYDVIRSGGTATHYHPRTGRRFIFSSKSQINRGGKRMQS